MLAVVWGEITVPMVDMSDIHGTKLVALQDTQDGTQVLTYLREETPSLPFPGQWDLPGGGVEPGETPEQCVLRETFEEFGLILSSKRLLWSRRYPNITQPGMGSVFFAAWLTAEEITSIQFGTEGQYWTMMEVSTYLAHPMAIKGFKPRLKDAVTALTT